MNLIYPSSAKNQARFEEKNEKNGLSARKKEASALQEGNRKHKLQENSPGFQLVLKKNCLSVKKGDAGSPA